MSSLTMTRILRAEDRAVENMLLNLPDEPEDVTQCITENSVTEFVFKKSTPLSVHRLVTDAFDISEDS